MRRATVLVALLLAGCSSNPCGTPTYRRPERHTKGYQAPYPQPAPCPPKVAAPVTPVEHSKPSRVRVFEMPPAVEVQPQCSGGVCTPPSPYTAPVEAPCEEPPQPKRRLVDGWLPLVAGLMLWTGLGLLLCRR